MEHRFLKPQSVRIPFHFEKGEWITYYNMPRNEMPRGKFTQEVRKLRGLGFKVRASSNKDRFFIMIKEPTARRK